ncbi:butyrate kinase [candidate division KSB1 bacterium]|nr:butyrate kinase [candidate division KSB1 bacterium]
MNFKLLIINPGSTSTKIAIFDDEQNSLEKSIAHSPKELMAFEKIWDQLAIRQRALQAFLAESKYRPVDFSAIVGRGGLLRSVPGGTYQISARMLEDARIGLQGEHAANLGCALAYELAQAAGIPAFIVDPISVDEFEPIARYSGHPLIQRRSLSHTLNLHAAGREAARRLGEDFIAANFVIAHLGGGISICPLKGGKIIDVNDASSDGPFSPERTGGLPLQPFINLCFSGNYTKQQVKKLVMGEGGLLAYTGTSSAREIEKRIHEGDSATKEIYLAMAYQIAKEIGAMATVLDGNVRAIVISGGLANSDLLVSWIKKRIAFIAEVLVLPGEFEMQALAHGALRVLRGEERAKQY